MMRRSRFLGVLAVLLGLTASLGGGSPVHAASDPTLIAPGARNASQLFPRTDGTTVVWFDTKTCQIMMANLNDRQPTPAVTVPSPCSFGRGIRFDIGDGLLVWSAGMGIFGKELATGRQFRATGVPDAPLSGPIISRNRVFWVSPTEGGPVLFQQILADGSAPTIIARLDPGWRLLGVIFNESWLAWVETSEGDREQWRLRTLMFGGAAPRILAERQARGVFGGAVLTDSMLVYSAQRAFGSSYQVLVVNLRTNERRVLIDQAESGGVIAISDRYIFLRTDTIDGYDLATDSRFMATRGRWDGLDGMADAAGGVLTWTRGPFEAASIHAAPITALLPSARRPDPGPSGPERAFFPETGHQLVYGFKGFWERNGALPVFGFPLTDEFRQRNADTGAWYTVQYLERQRFEYHPELGGTPYAVSLGRLGAEDAARRADLRGLWAFNPIEATADHPPGCRYLSEARHRLCGEFRPYWEGHGLDLGDAEVSFRESLALFGYPISEEFIDPDTGLITQYFERAVFEYHAEYPADQRVLLKRLGAARLAAFGW